MVRFSVVCVCCAFFSVAFAARSEHRAARASSAGSGASADRGVQGAAGARDGSRDFDFEIGNWRTHIRRLVKPLSGSKEWAEYDGTSVVKKIWDGRANLVELKVDGPAGHIEGISLRLYMPQARQWSLNFAGRGSGSLGVPTVGEFRNGRGEFFDQEEFGGRMILVRNVWSDITADAGRFEQSFSDDGGKTWEVNWVAKDTRVKDEAEMAALLREKLGEGGAGDGDTRPTGQRDFDFEVGSWNIHLKRLVKPLSGSHEWVEFDGTSVTRPLWDGRAQMEEFETEDPVSHKRIEGLTLRLYDTGAHQWRLYWAASADGVMEQPTIGEFRDGVGEFFDQEVRSGRAIYIKYVWTKTGTGKPHFEQSFSDDGGKTWEANWITDQVKVGR
jgi:hypothetical protein